MKRILITIFVIFLSVAVNVFADIETEMDTVIVTATRIAQHNYKIAGNVTVITKEEIAASNAQTVPEVLKQALGIYVFDQNTAKTSVIDMRGFGESAKSNILVLVNDRKINAADISGSDLIQIPIGAVERIETNHYLQRADFFRRYPVNRGDIVFLGDSITDGGCWEELFPGVPLKNRGI
ncbi:MAG TPA: TonB-dependent receptor plug domain-containing protein, partial [Candidatus Omnitrophota bacterium]|nr:TonB-dependent receptor plug domain-containing protein [Candidatus Omnitrophota bacterium]